ncbi:hypothetical protein CSQ85_08860 [Bifidobacterium rousetti]|uniref:hypothetical protein n=1 Tax=Bifidobacterium rousetti TaxID=2045439 RepID=UPI00123B59B4|nr:hypothetical protein [Bifidobacterium rousetti]KAA8818261.1 hypothetical protein CSQ85_08860 [Bifidobacterium rousetti]
MDVRRIIGAMLLVALALPLGACGSDTDADAGRGSDGATSSQTTTDTDDDATQPGATSTQPAPDDSQTGSDTNENSDQTAAPSTDTDSTLSELDRLKATLPYNASDVDTEALKGLDAYNVVHALESKRYTVVVRMTGVEDQSAKLLATASDGYFIAADVKYDSPLNRFVVTLADM